MDTHRKLWNQGHQKLQRALSANDTQKAAEIFLDQHTFERDRMDQSQHSRGLIADGR
jgi:hypothetical protein